MVFITVKGAVMKDDSKIIRSMWMTLAKNLIILIILAVVCFVGVWSWYTNKTTATAKGLSVSCQAPDGVEIAVVEHGASAPDDTAYSTSVYLDEASFLSKLVMSEVTSDGVNFLQPKLIQANGQAMPDPSKEWGDAVAGIDYICFDLYIRTKTPKAIYLSDESSVNPVAETLTWDSGEGLGNNPSASGNFSKDCLVGATRVSILNKENEKKLLWIPRPDIYLLQEGANYQVLTGLKDNSFSTYTHTYWQNPTDMTEADDVVTSDVSDNGAVKLGENIEITSFDADKGDAVTDGEEYVYSKVVVNLWTEGEDKEARLALAGGQFELNLKLISEQSVN